MTFRTGIMTRIWTTALASFVLIGFAAVVSATAIATSADIDARPAGRAMMVEAQYQLAMRMKR
ncbi:hypothetical protein COO09_07070 [Rhizorhabdus dicambivorans]|uniref:Uncharacterized protein n=2 Tax=Rhizorhabdus dicambivorans TaxID=1850238 RepID=A0A2A4FXY0_9SPHN|nr:hypothetical protein CMV14_17285 [Rhizorhabdus dicambivorans]PCE43055.1 hypothetical protein COO09_07070 [Rhizorhabdus dicambivorans]